MNNNRGSHFDRLPAGEEAPRTLIELLRLRAIQKPEQIAYTFLVDGEVEEANISYAELDRQSRAIAGLLQSLGAEGQLTLLLYPPGLDYIAAFFGCLYAGAIAVPAYPPRMNQSLSRLQSIIADTQPAFALASGPILARLRGMSESSESLRALRWLSTDELDPCLEGKWRFPEIAESKTAFLQYTSGSTASPKGVMISHANLLHNERMIQSVFRQGEESIIVSWLPLYHDMGLIGTMLQPLFIGARGILMSPTAFLQRPARWLEAISRYSATTSGGPNFAYDICVKRVTPEQRSMLNLSSWTVAFSGSEPIRAETLDRFADTFADCGFRKESFYPCYGLAEGTLLATGKMRVGPPVVRKFDGAAFENHHLKISGWENAGRMLVGCGGTLPDQRIVIADPDSLTLCPSDQVGEIWISGPSVAQGYWNESEETERTFCARLADTGEGPFLRTGDLGFLYEGELFITGRIKDVIIVRGLNHYPQDIELTVERSHPALRQGCGAAFSIEAYGQERLIIVQELERRHTPAAGAAIEAIRKAVVEGHELRPDAIALLKSGTIPKTSSGKIQRSACRALYTTGGLDIVDQWQCGAESDGAASFTSAACSFGGVKDIEEWLVSQVASQLGLDRRAIDVGDPLSTYGLDSLQAIDLAHGIETSAGVCLSSTLFLQGLSIAQVAARVFESLLDGNARAEPLAGAVGVEVDQSLLSYGQRSIWFLHQLAQDSPAYNISVPIRVKGQLDTAVLQASFQSLVDRHACLRSVFTSSGGEPSQTIRQNLEVCFNVLNAESLDATSLNDLLMRRSQNPFDLEAGPLLRVDLFRRSAGEHILLICVHHIIVDFWSLTLMIDELGKLYEAQGAAAGLQPVPATYADFVAWQKQTTAGSHGETLRSFWKKELGGELPILNLPTDELRPSAQLFPGATQSIIIDEESAKALKALSQARGVTLYTLLLAAFEILLHRYTGQVDFLVGTPTSGRSRAVFANVVGYFVNPVALRADLSKNPSFEEFLRRTRQKTRSAFDHQDYPYALLVEELRPNRPLSQSPLLQVMFALQSSHLRGREALAYFALNQPGAVVNLGDLAFESMELERQVAPFDLTLMTAEAEGHLLAAMQYRTDLFTEQTVIRMLGHLRALLRAVVERPSLRISDLPLLTDQERKTIIYTWNETGADHSQVERVNDLFEVIAEKNPEALALSFADESVTYAELNRRANKLAHYLRASGGGPEVAIAICAERSSDLVMGELAILKAGAAYLPIDPASPPPRILAMVDDAQSPFLLTRRHLAGRLVDCRARIICLDEPSEEIQSQSDKNPGGGVLLQNLAYLIYTSGSTGSPKGVAITHESLLNLVAWHHAAYAIEPADRASLLASPAFDASVWEIWPYLTARASIHIPDEEIRKSAQKLIAWLADENVTISFLPTPLAEAVLQETFPANIALRSLLIGGDRLNQYAPAYLPFDMVNHYGPTEDAVVTTASLVPVRPFAKTPPSIGRPIANKQLYILDSHLQPVPIGVAGELFISGAGLSRGYAHSPDLTAEKFIPNPFSDKPGQRLYMSGDMARYRADGQIEFLGRADHQVKLRGLRIELGEIESVIAAHPGVRETVVIIQQTVSGNDCLVSYIAPVKTSPVSQGELRSYLKQLLPDYMIPAVFVTLEQLPLTPNGKVNRKALPALEKARIDRGLREEPRTQMEELIAAVWSQALKVDHVHIDDNFFEMGGHSLLATQVIARLREAMQVEIPLRSLFESPTVAGMAATVQSFASPRRNTSPITRSPQYGKLPLSSAQQRLWFLDQLQPQSSFYNIPGGARMRGRLNVLSLKQSLNEVIRRHGILRTAFGVAEGQPVQLIDEAQELNISMVDLSRLPEGKEARLREMVAQESRRPFDLSSGRLLRATLYRSNDADHTLLLVIHHIIIDGWSLGILMREISDLYESYIHGRPSPLADLPLQYADYAIWQQAQMESDAFQAETAYWSRQFEGAPMLIELPLDHPRPPVQTHRGSSVPRFLGAGLLDSLKAISRAHSNTLFITLLGAFKALLYRYSGQIDILVGVPVAGRNRVELEGLIGLFVNTLVLRTNLAGDPSFAELANRAKAVAFSAFEHQDVPFEWLVEKLQPPRSLSHTPLFQVMFAMQNASVDQADIYGLRLSPVEFVSTSAKFDLTLMASESRHGLAMTIEYSSDLFDAVTIERMLSHLERMLDSLPREWSQRIASIPMLSPQEQEQLLRGWNSPMKQGDELCVHHLFDRQAELTPDAIAVEDELSQVTYERLRERSSKLASYLIEIGAGPEFLVGICMTRDVEMVAAMLAIMKAGAAYLPIDNTYPSQRIRYLLEDSGASVLLTCTAAAASLPQSSVTRVILDEHWRDIVRESPVARRSRVSAANLAYVIYTSGSTGSPKGVAIEHQSVVRFLQWAKAFFTRRELSAVLASTSICFDLSIFEIFAPLSTGGKIVIARDALRAKEIAATSEVTLINTVPSAMAELVLTEAIPPSVETINLAGEPLRRDLVEQIYAAAPVNRVINLYGPTEDTTYSTYAVIRRPADEPPTIGRSIEGSQVYALGPLDELAPAGVCGELHIGGGGLARGYLNRPELTAERFTPNPYSQKSGERFYKTGDQVKWDKQGRLQYIGRKDHQVKVRGYRVELAEIESILRRRPEVKDVVVILREDEPEDKRIVAYVVGAPKLEEAIAAELRDHLKESLPEYMLPSAFVFMDEAPLTLNGKVDRRALPAPDRKRQEGKKTFVAPRTDTEKIIASIWSEVLRIDEVGINDDFFTHGGHSLLATRVAAKLRVSFATEFPLRMLFEETTVARLAEAVDRLRRNGAAVLAPPMTAASRERYRVTTGANQRLEMPEILKKRRQAQRRTYEGRPSAANDDT